jgi:glycogen operon protein
VRDGVRFEVVATRAPVLLELQQPCGGRRVCPMARVAPGLWAIHVPGIGPGIAYRYRVGAQRAIALDPWAKAFGGGEHWGQEPRDWWSLVVEDDRPEVVRPAIDPADRVIYELHLRGYTRHPSSGVGAPGTYRGLIEKLDQIAELGVTTIELMPVCEFDETEVHHISPETGARLFNFWGYQPISWFAPKAAYAAADRPGAAIGELRELVAAAHTRGLEVIVDMVYNHTGERPDRPGVASLSVLAPEAAFLLPPGGEGRDYTGCGNTVRAQHPLVRRLIRESMRWWVEGIGVDGFRLDLAAVLARGDDGKLLEEPPILAELRGDDVLRSCLILAEPWDAGGAYMLGSFARLAGWSEWNGRFRDDVRRFVRSEARLAHELAIRLAGSPDIFGGSEQGPLASVNFLTCHDGFTLADLVTYEHKHNLGNGEDNRDGNSWNHSSNAGVEGPTGDPAVLAVRRRRVRSMLIALVAARGIPMILAGDEIGRTQRGNNNPWCRDDEVGWVVWDGPDLELRDFVRALLAWRRARPQLRQPGFEGEAELDWHGGKGSARAQQPTDALLAVEWPATATAPAICIGFNGTDRPRVFGLPQESGRGWRVIFDTAVDSGADAPGHAGGIGHRSLLRVEAHAALVLEEVAEPGQMPADPPNQAGTHP